MQAGETLGSLLRADRARRGDPKLKSYGEMMGANPDQIGRWIRDESFPGPEMRPRVAEHLGIAVAELDALDPKAGRGRPRVSQPQEHARTRAMIARLAEQIDGLANRITALEDRRGVRGD